MNLFINYYDNPERQDELDYCLKTNLSHPLIERVIIFNESERKFRHKKVVNIGSKKRPTYQDFFDATKNYPDDVNIISNLDIYFDQTLEHAKFIKPNVCYALTRYEHRKEGPVFFEDAHGNKACKALASQDVWMFRGAVNMTGCDKVEAVNLSNERNRDFIRFTMGVLDRDWETAEVL